MRNRSGFLAGIMRKHGSASVTAAPLPSVPRVQLGAAPGRAGADKGREETETQGALAAPTVAVVVGGKVVSETEPPQPTPAAAETGGMSSGQDSGAGNGLCTQEPEVEERQTVDDSAKEASVDKVPTGGERNAPVKGEGSEESQDEEKGGVMLEAEGEEDVGIRGTINIQDNKNAELGDEEDDGHGSKMNKDDAGERKEDEAQEHDHPENDADDDNSDGGDQVTEEQLSRRAQKRREEEEVRKLLEEEGDVDDADIADGDGGAADGVVVSELDRLTGKPRDDDVLLFAVPVCGPYMSMRDYRYKVRASSMTCTSD